MVCSGCQQGRLAVLLAALAGWLSNSLPFLLASAAVWLSRGMRCPEVRLPIADCPYFAIGKGPL